MQSLKYGYFVEDIAQAVFLESILPQIVDFLGQASNIEFLKDEKFAEEFTLVAEGRNQFEKFCAEICEQGLTKFEQNIFFLARDAGAKQVEVFEEIYNRLTNSLLSHQNQVIIFVPIRCTEYWFRYIKERRKLDFNENSQIEIFEEQKKNRIKNNVYPKDNEGKRLSEAKILLLNEYSQKVDIAFLAKHSFSFRHFLTQIETFLKRIS
ncbi:MAG: hypothetical protein MUE85_23720 [Microscillaceae bacterium]|nr:hypothetical protein [Microscillaceae bacterium]